MFFIKIIVVIDYIRNTDDIFKRQHILFIKKTQKGVLFRTYLTIYKRIINISKQTTKKSTWFKY